MAARGGGRTAKFRPGRQSRNEHGDLRQSPWRNIAEGNIRIDEGLNKYLDNKDGSRDEWRTMWLTKLMVAARRY